MTGDEKSRLDAFRTIARRVGLSATGSTLSASIQQTGHLGAAYAGHEIHGPAGAAVGYTTSVVAAAVGAKVKRTIERHRDARDRHGSGDVRDAPSPSPTSARRSTVVHSLERVGSAGLKGGPLREMATELAGPFMGDLVDGVGEALDHEADRGSPATDRTGERGRTRQNDDPRLRDLQRTVAELQEQVSLQAGELTRLRSELRSRKTLEDIGRQRQQIQAQPEESLYLAETARRGVSSGPIAERTARFRTRTRTTTPVALVQRRQPTTWRQRAAALHERSTASVPGVVPVRRMAQRQAGRDAGGPALER